MSLPAEEKPPLNRNATLLSMHVALVIHAVNHDRVWLCVLAGLATLWAARARPRALNGNLTLWLSAAAGAVLGGVALLFAEPPPSPLPPELLSPLCGGLMGLMVHGCYTGSHVWARVYAWLLVALSCNVDSTPQTWALVLSMAVAELLANFVHLRIWDLGLGAWVGLLLLMVLAAPAGWGMVSFIQSNEGMLMGVASRYLAGAASEAPWGLGNTVELGRTSSVVPTGRILFELKGARPARLRTHVLDLFDGTIWRTSRVLRQQRPPWPTPARTHTFSLLTWDELPGVVPAPAGSTRVDGAAEVVLAGGQVVQGRASGGTHLQVYAGADEKLMPVPPLAGLTAVPKVLAADMPALAAGITAGASTNAQRVAAVEAHFRDGYLYSLDTDLSGPQHPLLTLIKEHRAAYCTYFASAAIMLLRAQGIPARMVGGFIPEEVGPDGTMVVRQRDAHAWVEAWVDGRWHVADPTPWQSRQQALGLAHAPAWFSSAAEWMRRWVVRAWLLFKAAPAQAAWAALTHPLLWSAVAWVLFRRWQRNRRQRTRTMGHLAASTGPPALMALHSRYVAALKAAGVMPPQPFETEEEALARMPQDIQVHAAAFVREWLRTRFGGMPQPGALSDALASLEAVPQTQRQG